MSDRSGDPGLARGHEAVRAALGGFAPSDEQWKVITAPDGPVLVVAGAGTGKTGVLAARVAWLLAREDDQRSVLCLTYGTRAALQLRERLARVTLPQHADPVSLMRGDAVAGGSFAPAPVGTHQHADRDLPVVSDDLDAGHRDRVQVATYHAFGAGLLRRYGARLGLAPGAQMLSEGAQLRLCSEVLTEVAFTVLPVRSASRVAGQALELAQECADHLVLPEDIQAHARALRDRGGVPGWIVRQADERAELAKVVTRYTARKRALGWHDRGDQIVRAVELLEAHPEIAKRFQTRYCAVVVDEYQDTNAAQGRLLQLLCPPGSSVMAVGDERQAIYGFRGATTRNIRTFGDPFSQRRPLSAFTLTSATLEAAVGGGALLGVGLTRATLSQSFRCDSRILAVANALAGSGQGQAGRAAGGESGTDPFSPPPLVEREGAPRGIVRAALLADENDEAAFVVSELLDARAAAKEGGTELAWRDMAVIARSRRFLEPMRRALAAREIPVQGAMHGSLLQAPEVVDLVCILRVLVRPTDNVAFVRLAMGPRWRIGYVHIARLSQWAATQTRALRAQLAGEDPDAGELRYGLVEALDHLRDVPGLDGGARARLAQLREHLVDLRSLLGLPLVELVHEVAERSGLVEELAVLAEPVAEDAVDGASGDWGRGSNVRTRVLDAFFEYVGEYVGKYVGEHVSPGEPESLQALLSFLDATAEARERVEMPVVADADAVHLLTVHAAKGLEFHTVAVVGLAGGGADGLAAEGLFPDSRPRSVGVSALPAELRDDRDQLTLSSHWPVLRKQLRQVALEDERRVAYVAVTRASRRLVLSAAWWYQVTPETAQGPSLFWREAVSALDQDGDAVTQVVIEVECTESNPLEPSPEQEQEWPLPDGVDVLPGFDVSESAAVDAASARHGSPPPGLSAADLAVWERACARLRQDMGAAGGASPTAPVGKTGDVVALSVSEVLEYVRCPLAFYWSVVEAFPQPSLLQRREGERGHALLERGLALQDPPARRVLETARAVCEEEDLRAERLRASLARERLSGLGSAEREVGFLLRRGRWAIRGRIDAIYRRTSRGLSGVEVVDWKFGRPSVPVFPETIDQLSIYALALRDLGGLPGGSCTVTYCFLGGNGAAEEHSRDLNAAALAAQDALLDAALARLAAGLIERCGQPGCVACRRGMPVPASLQLLNPLLDPLGSAPTKPRTGGDSRSVSGL